MGIDVPTGEMSPRVTWMPSVSSEALCRAWLWKMVKMRIYQNGHCRLKGWEIGHGGRYWSGVWSVHE